MRGAVIFALAVALGVGVARLRTRPQSPSSLSPVDQKTSEDHNPVPQRFEYKQVVHQRDIEPSDTRYDPVSLLREEQGELTTKELFEREPKDAHFAPVLERRIESALETVFHELELDDKIGRVQVECKTLSCMTRIEVAKSDGAHVYDEINGILLGDVQEPGIDDTDPNRTYVTFANLYRPEMRNDATYQRFVAEGMGPPLEYAKQRMKARDESRR